MSTLVDCKGGLALKFWGLTGVPMAPRKGNSDRQSSVPERQRVGAVLTDAAAAKIGPQAKSPLQLYEECAGAERDSAKTNLDPIKIFIGKKLLFGQPLFDDAPTMNDRSVIDKVVDLKIRMQLWQGQKYRDILAYIRGCASQADRNYVIAWWLKLENVCEPEEFFGPEEFRKMARRKLFFLSNSEFRHAQRVFAWLPYFVSLLKDMKERTIAQLVSLGYEESCVAAARGKRSAVEAACNWRALRGDSRVDALTLRNAYSKLYGPKRFQRRGNSLKDNT